VAGFGNGKGDGLRAVIFDTGCYNGKKPVIAMQTTTSTAIPDPAVMEYMEQQAQQFEALRSQLLQSHGRQFVWFEAGQVLDADVDFSALCDRVMHFAADRPTFIRQVLPVDPQPIVRTPLKPIG
jgi:hypothetical protein